MDAGEDCNFNTAADNLTLTCKFDNAGRTVNEASTDSSNTLLGVTASAYSKNSGTSGKNNRLMQGVSTGVLNTNLLRNGSFELTPPSDLVVSDWNTHYEKNYAGCNIAWNTGRLGRDGACMLRMYIPGGADGQTVMNYAWQTRSLTAGTQYTFSAYARVDSMDKVWDGGGVYITIYDSGWNVVAKSDVIDHTTSGIDDGWEQLYVNYTPETSGTYLMVLCQRNCGKSQIAFDDVQLETGTVASSYNLTAERRYDI